MCPRIRPIMAAAVVLVLCRAAVDQGTAKIIRNGKDGPVHAAAEAGGHPLPLRGNDNGPPVVIPYTLIGPISAENGWFPPWVVWPWRMVSPFPMHLHGITGR